MDTNPCYLLLDPVKLMVSLEFVCNRHQHHQLCIYIYTHLFLYYIIIYEYNWIYMIHIIRETNALSASAASRCYVVLKCISHEMLLATSIHCAFAEAEQGWTTRMNRGHWWPLMDIGSPWWTTRMCPFPVCSPEAIHHVSLSAPVQRDMIKHD